MPFATEQLEKYMLMAIAEAEESLRQGNHGFGALVACGGDVVAIEHDTDETDQDPTAHAELKAIRKASAAMGKDLSGCILVCTHEPCPMCAGAIVWSKMGSAAYGCGIGDSIANGRERIAVSCREIFDRAKAVIHLEEGILKERCAVLYNRNMRTEIKRLRNASDQLLAQYDKESGQKRLDWYANLAPSKNTTHDPLERAYELLLNKLEIAAVEAPIIHRDKNRLMFHSKNFCPTLEACKVLRLDTRKVCKLYNEGATQELLQQIDVRLTFTRNYEKLRPYSEYCEELIEYHP